MVVGNVELGVLRVSEGQNGLFVEDVLGAATGERSLGRLFGAGVDHHADGLGKLALLLRRTVIVHLHKIFFHATTESCLQLNFNVEIII